jgi:TPR repeat protein
MYEQGQGVSQDEISAFVWYNLSAASGEEKHMDKRDELKRTLSEDKLVIAENLSREIQQRIETNL